MKKSELKKIQTEYAILRSKLNSKNISKQKEIRENLKKLERRYFHETGEDIPNQKLS